jgi:Mor family transcriptional regulator
MKKLSFILIVAMALIGAACTKSEAPSTETATRAASNQNKFEIAKVINESDIDLAIMEFVITHFPQTGILHCYQTQHYYKVKLEDRTHLEFTHSFEWVKADCEHSTIYTSVPTSIVPEQITAYVTTNFPGKTIEEIEKKSFGWEIEMKNGPEIKFDTNFNVINGGGNGGGNNSNFPEINTFVSTYFPQVSIQRVELDGNEIDVKLTDGTDIDFYLNFIWQSIDCEHATVYGSVPSELVPVQITDYVTANFPGKHIDSIEKKYNGWEIELSNGLEITFDSNFNVTGFDDKK